MITSDAKYLDLAAQLAAAEGEAASLRSTVAALERERDEWRRRCDLATSQRDDAAKVAQRAEARLADAEGRVFDLTAAAGAAFDCPGHHLCPRCVEGLSRVLQREPGAPPTMRADEVARARAFEAVTREVPMSDEERAFPDPEPRPPSLEERAPEPPRDIDLHVKVMRWDDKWVAKAKGWGVATRDTPDGALATLLGRIASTVQSRSRQRVFKEAMAGVVLAPHAPDARGNHTQEEDGHGDAGRRATEGDGEGEGRGAAGVPGDRAERSVRRGGDPAEARQGGEGDGRRGPAGDDRGLRGVAGDAGVAAPPGTPQVGAGGSEPACGDMHYATSHEEGDTWKCCHCGALVDAVGRTLHPTPAPVEADGRVAQLKTQLEWWAERAKEAWAQRDLNGDAAERWERDAAAQRARADAAEAALREIADHPHNTRDLHAPSPPQGAHERAYAQGIEDGHRCAATIARGALGRPGYAPVSVGGDGGTGEGTR